MVSTASLAPIWLAPLRVYPAAPGKRKVWTNYENNGNKYLVVGDIARFEYPDIQGSVFLI